ncbi:O-antigen ligase family protein [Deinococcus sonorensis]|uniref:O-antigen ligase family protein n=2 Tax=Deinococcus sonorensis TaxID=309891 RepID=A0AAU7UER5_9DEIO
MIAIRILTVALPFVLSFFLLPTSTKDVVSTLYTPHTVIVIAFALIISVMSFIYEGRNSSLVDLLIKFRPSPIILLALAYTTWILICSYLSPMPGYAFLGSPFFEFGSIAIISCLFIVRIYAKYANVQAMMRMLALITIIMAMITVLEAIGFRPLASLVGSEKTAYPAALIGHRPHLGGWFAALALAPIFFYRKRVPDGWFWSWLTAGLIGLALTTTSTALIGALVGLLMWVGNGIRSRKVLPLLVLLVFLGSIKVLPVVSQTIGHQMGHGTTQFKNLASASTVETRLLLWRSATTATLERPLIGWGDETFAYQVFEHLKPSDAKTLFREELGLNHEYNVIYKGFTYYITNPKADYRRTGSLMYVRAHNIVFDELYSHGALGFLLFISLLITVLWWVMQRGKGNAFFFLIATLPFCIFMLAWFYIPTVAPIFFILIGTMLADLKSSSRFT